MSDPSPTRPTYCGFVPAYLLERLAAATDDRLVRCGSETLAVDRRFRADRESLRAGVRATAVGGPAAAADGSRVVHTAGNTEQLPGQRVRGEGDPTSGDAAVDEAWESSGQVLQLFDQVFGRAGVDGAGGTVTISVHYGADYDNAFWNGSQLVFGDGDGTVFDRFTKPFDVMAHEFTHGVTDHTARLTYAGQSGALNESVSDVFAVISTQRAAGQTAEQADWLIGRGLFLPGINATALRSMKAPGTAYDDPQLGRDPQVGSMADYLQTSEDNGGVHTNSGIPNRAFYLAATGIGGNSWEAPGAIWYDTLTASSLPSDADFATFAAATVASAQKLFADRPEVAAAVTAAWREVGVLAADDSVDRSADTDSVPADSVPTDSAPAEPPRTVTVRRSGGVTGVTREAEIDLDTDEYGDRLRSLLDPLLDRADLWGARPEPTAPAGADRFTYTVRYGAAETVVGEHQLGPELGQVVRLVLDR